MSKAFYDNTSARLVEEVRAVARGERDGTLRPYAEYCIGELLFELASAAVVDGSTHGRVALCAAIRELGSMLRCDEIDAAVGASVLSQLARAIGRAEQTPAEGFKPNIKYLEREGRSGR